jgi:hypothetical protein
MKENVKAIIIVGMGILSILFLSMSIYTGKWIYIPFGIICFGIVKIILNHMK